MDPVTLGVKMCEAAAVGDVESIRRLLVNGASVDSCDYDKRTPIHLAASNNQLEVLRFLLENNADVNVKCVHWCLSWRRFRRRCGTSACARICVRFGAVLRMARVPESLFWALSCFNNKPLFATILQRRVFVVLWVFSVVLDMCICPQLYAHAPTSDCILNAIFVCLYGFVHISSLFVSG